MDCNHGQTFSEEGAAAAVAQPSMRSYLEEAIKSFDADPPDSDYQRGYLAALQTVLGDNYHSAAQRSAACCG